MPPRVGTVMSSARSAGYPACPTWTRMTPAATSFQAVANASPPYGVTPPISVAVGDPWAPSGCLLVTVEP